MINFISFVDQDQGALQVKKIIAVINNLFLNTKSAYTSITSHPILSNYHRYVVNQFKKKYKHIETWFNKHETHILRNRLEDEYIHIITFINGQPFFCKKKLLRFQYDKKYNF